MKQKNSKWKILTNGIFKENPVLILLLGCCSVLAISVTVSGALGMGVAMTFVLVCSNVVSSLLRKIIPDKIRIPCFIVVIATFVTLVQMLVQAFVPALYDALGIFLPLIVVNCIILGRAEMFAGKNPVIPSILDGLGMGIGFTAALLCMGIIRELLGSGSLFGIQLLPVQILIFILPPGGFFVFGMLIMLANKLNTKAGKQVKTKPCDGCPMADKCSQSTCANTEKEVATDAD